MADRTDSGGKSLAGRSEEETTVRSLPPIRSNPQSGTPALAAQASPITFSRLVRHWAAKACVSRIETPKSSKSSSSSGANGGRRTPSATGSDSDQRALDRLPVALVRVRHVPQELGAEGDVAVLVAGDVAEPLDEAGQRALLLVVADDEVLAGEGEHPLDDHVVERDRLDQRLGSSGSLASLSTRERSISSKSIANSDSGALDAREPRGEVVRLEHADLLVEAVEEAHVARLVGDLRSRGRSACPRSAPRA